MKREAEAGTPESGNHRTLASQAARGGNPKKRVCGLLTSKLFADAQSCICNYCEKPMVHVDLGGSRVASLCFLAERQCKDVKR
jgi:hypothetical protein